MKTNSHLVPTRITVVLSGNIHGVNSFYREAADELIVFLHGLGCSSRSFEKAWECNELEGYSLLCLDYPGHGDSEAPESFGYSVEEHARVCSAILAAYRHRPVHVVGHSLGGAVALLLSDSVRSAIVSFANVEGNLNSEDCIYGSRPASEKALEEFVSDQLPTFQRSSQTWCDVGLDVVDPRAFYETAVSLVKWSDSGALLDRFRSWPGRKGYFFGSENADHPTLQTISGIDQYEIPGAGHFVMNDNPAQFYSTLARFIKLRDLPILPDGNFPAK